MCGKEVKHLKKRTVAYCNSADIDMTIPFALTQVLWILDVNAKGKVVPLSLEQKIACG